MTDYHTAIVGRLLPLLDLTSLNDGFDDDIAELCEKANSWSPEDTRASSTESASR